MSAVELARLALPEDPARSGLYWRGQAELSGDGKSRLSVPAGARLDLGTWFNAAPVGWWHRVLGAGQVRLAVTGSGALRVWRSSGGRAEVVVTAQVDGDWSTHLPRSSETDWYWIDLEATDNEAWLEQVRWTVPGRTTRESTARVTVVVPTFGNPDEAFDQLDHLLAPALEETVGRVVLIDQGRTVRAHHRAEAAFAAAGDRLVFVEQDNLGGSGGYARGMLESLAFPDDPVLLHDDDARVEPESLRRLLALSTAAPRPTILGTGLLSAEAPTSLEALAEGVRRRGFVWGPTDGVGDGVDVAHGTPADWSFARSGARTDYAGWWGTLLPAGAVDRVGLAAPFFLKWDDAEYGLRAEREGVRTVTVPGMNVWHPTWAAKGTISSWSAWPLHRNRFATALAYGAGRSVVLDSLVHQVKHVLSLQYDTGDLWDGALGQVLAGPEWLSSDLRTVRGRAQSLLDENTQREPATEGFPVDARGRGGLLPALTGLVRPFGTRRVAVSEAAAFTWRTGLGRDVVQLEGASRKVLVRQPARARRALARTLRLHLRLALRWRALRRAYARELPVSRSREAWEHVIGIEGSAR